MNEDLPLLLARELHLRTVLVLIGLVLAAIIVIQKKRKNRKSAGSSGRGSRVNRIGFMFNFREGTFPDRPYLLYRMVPMAELLRESGSQLFMYSPRHVDPDTGTVLGYVIDNGRFVETESAVPHVNGNWYLGSDLSIHGEGMSGPQFQRWAKDNDIEIYPPPDFSRLLKDKYRTFRLLAKFDRTLHPHTELYVPARDQVAQFLDRGDAVYLKPRRGNQGNGVLVLERDAEGFRLARYERKRRHVTTGEALPALVEAINRVVGDERYVIQEGIDVERCGDASFIVRVIMVHDGQRWHWIHKAVRAAPGSHVANTSQGGSNHTLVDLFSMVYTHQDVDWLVDRVRHVSFAITSYLEGRYPDRLMEIAFDFVIDRQRNVHIVELNTHPGMTKPGMPLHNAFEDIFNRTPQEQVLYDRYVVGHATHLARFLQKKLQERGGSKRQESPPATPQDGQAVIKRVEVAAKPPTGLRLLLVGDTGFGEPYQERLEEQGGINVLKKKGYDYSLEKVSELLEQSDFVVANLETPLTDLAISPLYGKKRYIHWSHPARGPGTLKRHGIDAVSLANNHAFDYGDAGLRQTLEALQEHGLSWLGAGRHAAEASRPLVREFVFGRSSFTLAVVAGKHRTRKYDYHYYAATGAGGVNGWTRSSATDQIRTLRQTGPGALIVAFPHWGHNYKWRTGRQTRLAHELIDAGADIVIGHGAHMMQEIEQYRGRWVIYGLGNFVLNSPGRYQKSKDAVPFSLAARLDVQSKQEEHSLSLRLYPLFSDNRKTNYQPRLVTDQELQEVLACLVDRSPAPNHLRKHLAPGKDDLGHFLAVDLPWPASLGPGS